MKLKISLYTRFMFWIMILLILLVGIILFVIQGKEVQTIFEETRSRGILAAQYIANLNLRSLVLWDEETLLKNVESQTDQKLVYIVFFDRNGKRRAANQLVSSLEEVVCCSHLPRDARADSYFIRSRSLEIQNRLLKVLEIELPVFVTGSPTRWASIMIGHSLEDMQAEVRKTRRVLILIGLGVFLIGLLGSAVLAKKVTRPLKDLVEGTIRISQGDFSHRIKLASRDEIGDLARSFNEMMDQLLQAKKRMEVANRRLVQAEKLASIGRLSATIAHEIRNPLTSVKLNVQRIAESEKLEAVEREHINISQEGIGQIEKFIKELLDFTRVSELHVERFSLEQILESSLKTLKDIFQQKGVVIKKSYPATMPSANVDGDKMRQVFLNILRNAWESIDEGGEIRLSVELTSASRGRRFLVKISDNGCGIPEADWDNIFEPFFTTKASGFGLGLANARKIVEQHGGSIKVVKKKGKGSTFVVAFPCEEGQ